MKKTVVLGLALGIALTVGVTAAAGSFPDVPDDHWAAGAVATSFEEGIFIGYPDGTFLGGSPLTRYEATMIIERLLKRMEGMLLGDERALEEVRQLREDLGLVTGDLEAEVEGLKEETADLQQLREGLRALEELTMSLEEEVAGELRDLRAEIESLRGAVAAIDTPPVEPVEEREVPGILAPPVPPDLRAPGTPIPWAEYSPPESRFSGMDVSASYRYFDDQYEDDRDSINPPST